MGIPFPGPCPPNEGGGAFQPLLAVCQPNLPILDPKTSFDSPGLQLCEYFEKYLIVTDDVTSRVKGQMF